MHDTRSVMNTRCGGSGLTRGRARHENLTVIGKKNVVGTIDTYAYVGYVKEGDIRHLEGSRRNLKHVIRL